MEYGSAQEVTASGGARGRRTGNRFSTLRSSLVLTLLVATLGMFAGSSSVAAQQLDDLPLERWKELRENERYQLQIAEKYYRERNWKVAVAEYEKFLSLYEKSIGAPYAQLKWSLGQVQLKKQNTAIKEGFQSVIDYWPDSQEAIAAAFYLGHTYKQIGQNAKAKTAYRDVINKHGQHVAAVYAMSDLAEMAVADKDPTARLELLRKLAFDVKRTGATNGVCVTASQHLATLAFEKGNAEEAIKSLATTYPPDQLPAQVVAFARQPLVTMAAMANTKVQGEKTADAAVGVMRTTMPSDTTDPMKQAIARQHWYAIADLYALSGRDPLVMQTYEQLAKTLGASDEALGRLAQFQKSRMKYEDARATYRRYMNAAEGLGLVAYSYREQSQWDSAVQTYNQLIGQDAENAAKWKGELAATYRAAKKWKEAAGTYEDLIASDSKNHGRWRWELASMHREAGQYKEAIGHFRQCDNFPENFKQMAWCHRQLKEQGEAILLYRQIVASDPNSAAWALLQVGHTQEEAGQKEPAIQTFQQVCKRFPKDSHASLAHAHLQTKYKISITLGGAKEGE